MSYTIFTSNPTALIAQPGRAVNTFPSGLVRVDQAYLGLTSQAATHRAILAVGNDMPDGDTSPCIDGLKIFPEVQERRREDGFTEYLVSAYGRVNTTGKAESNFQAGFFNQTLSVNNSVNGTRTIIPCLNEIITFSKTLLPSAFPSTKLPDGAVLRIWVAANTEQAERLNVAVGDYVLLEQAYPPGETIQPPGTYGGITYTETTKITHTISIFPEFITNESTLYGAFKEDKIILRAAGNLIRVEESL